MASYVNSLMQYPTGLGTVSGEIMTTWEQEGNLQPSVSLLEESACTIRQTWLDKAGQGWSFEEPRLTCDNERIRHRDIVIINISSTH